ncbi:MAG: hypothetical protein ACLP7F_14225 [Acidimicrobiales bacterium]
MEERLVQAASERRPTLTFDQLAEGLRHARPPSADDVTITSDGRRIDSRDKALAWVEEMNALPRTSGRGAVG